jgi:hypothetical protein
MILALCYMNNESYPFDKIKCDSVRVKQNGVKELVKDSEVFCKLAKFVSVKIKEVRL